MSGADVLTEVERIQPVERVDEVTYRAVGSVASCTIWRGEVPSDSALAASNVETFAVTEGETFPDGSTPVPYVIAQVAVEHVEGSDPAIVDMRAKPGKLKLALEKLLPTVLSKANVTRGRVDPERTNVAKREIENLGHKPNDNGDFLITAA